MRNHIALVAVVAALLAGCSTLKNTTAEISAGDDKAKVLRLLGTPDDRQFQGKSEAWQYGTVVAFGMCEYTIVWFTSGTVTGLNTYRNDSYAGCRVGLRPVQWDSAPDRVIEVRQR